jgi:Na+/H+ antiporter NhaD/arsenite permease-like protein
MGPSSASASRRDRTGSKQLSSLVGGAIFVLTLLLIMLRPRGLPEAVSVSAALLVVIGRFVRPASAGRVLASEWNRCGPAH